MVVIYTQDNTIIWNDADVARESLISLYGKKLGGEAYAVIKTGRIGSTYRKYGGPLVKVVSKKEAEFIRKKETFLGLL